MHKKNTILIFLLCLVAAPLFFSVYTIIEKKIIEEQMEEKMEHENLQTVTLNAASIIWLKINKEMLINGEPFDVKTITTNGNRVTVSGLFDGKETKLRNQLQAFNNTSGRSASTNKSLLLMFFTICYHEAGITADHLLFSNKKQTCLIQQDEICNSYNEILIPPPRPSWSVFSI